MKGEQKEQAVKGMEEFAAKIKGEKGEKFREVTRGALGEKLIPKNALGMSDAMVEGLYAQAYRLYNTGKYKDASQLFRLLLTLNATEPKYAMGLAACFHMIKEYHNAINTYSLCGIMDADSPIPHYHASDCYLQLKDRISAIISLEMAIKRAGDKEEYRALKDRALMTVENLRKELGEKPSGKVKKNKKAK